MDQSNPPVGVNTASIMPGSTGASKHRKIAVVGARNVGKSSITVQFVESHFVESYYPTIENEFSRTVKLGKVMYTLEICDTAGQDEFSLVNNRSLMGVAGFLVVYSVVNRHSFELVGLIRDKILDQLGLDENVPVVVVGNKIDLCPDGGNDRQVTREEGQQLAKSLGAGFSECSAKLNWNVEDVMMLLLKKIEGVSTRGSRSIGSDGASSGAHDERCCVM